MNVASLTLNVNSGNVAQATSRLDALSGSANRADRASGVLAGSWGKLMGVVGAATGAIYAAKKFADTVVEYENLEAQLRTATGTAEGAAVAFDRLKVFATETPYALNQSVDAFIKLVNLGLTPSEKALRSYGDTASAMGKDLTTMVQAVSNATVGEFEMLKQFGIKAQDDGDKVRFIFRGVSTEVSKTAADIEKYMIQLGEMNFAGAMTEKMKTLGGAFSNLEDAWDQMVYTMAKSGPSDALKSALGGITEELNNLTKAFESGQATKHVEAFFNKFSTGATAAKQGLKSLREMMDSMVQGSDLGEAVASAFANIPENIAAVSQAMGATFGYMANIAERTLSYISDEVSSTFRAMIDIANAAWEALKARDPSIFWKQMDKSMTNSGKSFDAYLDDLSYFTDAYGNQITTILNARDASVARTAALKAEGDAMRAAADTKGPSTTPLESTVNQGSSSAGPQFVALQKSLQGEVEEIRRSYEERRAIINAEDNASMDQKAMLYAQLDAMEESATRQRIEKMAGNQEMELAQLQTGADSAIMVEDLLYQRKLDSLRTFLDAKGLTEDEYNKQRAIAAQIHAKKTEEIERNSAQARMQMQSQLLGSFASVASGLESMMKQGSAAQKAAFVAGKAIAIAQAIVNTELAATSAMAQSGHPILGMSMATAIRVAGYASVGLIAAQTVMGLSQHEHGGMIPAGRSGIVGEAGAEIVRGPAMVTSARTTADMLRGARGGGGNVSINVINNAGASVEVQESGDGNEKSFTLLINRVKKELASDLRTGGNEFSSTFESTYRMRRGGMNSAMA